MQNQQLFHIIYIDKLSIINNNFILFLINTNKFQSRIHLSLNIHMARYQYIAMEIIKDCTDHTHELIL